MIGSLNVFGFTFCLLVPPSTDNGGDNINAVCSQDVTMSCSASGNPQPVISWTFWKLFSSQPLKIKASPPTPFGWMKYQSNISLDNVHPGDKGTYQCLINNTVGDSRKVVFMLNVTCKYLIKMSLITLNHKFCL